MGKPIHTKVPELVIVVMLRLRVIRWWSISMLDPTCSVSHLRGSEVRKGRRKIEIEKDVVYQNLSCKVIHKCWFHGWSRDFPMQSTYNNVNQQTVHRLCEMMLKQRNIPPTTKGNKIERRLRSCTELSRDHRITILDLTQGDALPSYAQWFHLRLSTIFLR